LKTIRFRSSPPRNIKTYNKDYSSCFRQRS